MVVGKTGKMLFSASFIFSVCLFGVGDAQTTPDYAALTRNLAQQGRCPESNPQACAVLETTQAIVGRENCSQAQHCCYVNATCYLKELYRATPNQAFSMQRVAQHFLDVAVGDDRVISRNPLRPEDIQNLFPSVVVTPKFPDSCVFALQNIEPQINIPYCQRIPCQSTNPFLDTDPNLCFTLPGCAFDIDLFVYRQVLGLAILPGVPICHLAVRNKVFHDRVEFYTRQSNKTWNPLLTECLINIFSDEIFSPAPECTVIKALQELGYKPKRAGWKSISQRDCSLINGCWIDKTCLYPFKSSPLNTKTDFNHIPIELQSFLLNGGSPTCLPFDNVTNGDYLDAYHECYKSGCAMESDKYTLLRNLHGAATTYLPRYLQHQYWTMVLLGQVRADNWKFVADRLISETANNNFLNRILPQAQTQLNSGPSPSGGVSLTPFALSFNSSSGSLLNSPFLSFGTFGQFASSNVMEVNSDADSRQLPGNRRPANNGRNFNLQNLGGSVNRGPANVAGTPPWRNLQSLLSGIEPEAPIPDIDAGDDERALGLLSLLPCFFQPIQWPNFPPLSGSFEGCCDRPLCFIPRTALQSVKSEIASYKTFWTTWAPCSVTCGGGDQSRRRFCIGDYCGDDKEEIESQSCSSTVCPTTGTYSSWSAFSPCSATCGNGMRTRNRRCLLPPPLCTETTTQSRRCIERRCPSLIQGNWSPCSTSCGVGTQRRSVSCTSSDRSLCPATTFEERECPRHCGRAQTKINCDTTICYLVRSLECLQSSGRPGYCGANFRPSERRTSRKCYVGRCCDVHRPRNRQVCYRTTG